MLKMRWMGYFKKSDCQIKGFHLHKYQKDGMIRYIPKENMYYQGYDWTPGISCIDYYDKDLIAFETRKRLLKISENEDMIRKREKVLHDYVEYEYEEEYIVNTGKVMVPMTEYEWTTDPEGKDLTGNTRICHPMFFAYKIEENERGKLALVQSPYVDDILAIKREYPYFRERFIEIIHTEGPKINTK